MTTQLELGKSYLVRMSGVQGGNYRLNVTKQGMYLFEPSTGKLIKPIDSEQIGRAYVVERELKSVTSKWNLEYWIRGKCKEVLVRNVDFGVIAWTRNQCKNTHKEGMMIPVRVEQCL